MEVEALANATVNLLIIMVDFFRDESNIEWLESASGEDMDKELGEAVFAAIAEAARDLPEDEKRTFEKFIIAILNNETALSYLDTI